MNNWTKRTTFLLICGLALIIVLGAAAYVIRKNNTSTEISVPQVARVKVINKSAFWEPPAAKVVWQMEWWQSGVLRPDFNKWLVDPVKNSWAWLQPDFYDRQNKGAVSYTMEVQSTYSGDHYVNKIEYPYTGQYDHGAYFEPPSEFLLPYYSVNNVYTEYDDGLICINPSRNPKNPEPLWGSRVNLWLGQTNEAWYRHGKRLGTDTPRECEIFLDKKTGRVVSERMVFSFNNAPSKITCTYEYGAGPFPVGFTLKQDFVSESNKAGVTLTNITQATCKVIDGLWFITSYEVKQKHSDSDKLFPQYSVKIKDINITPLKTEKNLKAK